MVHITLYEETMLWRIFNNGYSNNRNIFDFYVINMRCVENRLNSVMPYKFS